MPNYVPSNENEAVERQEVTNEALLMMVGGCETCSQWTIYEMVARFLRADEGMTFAEWYERERAEGHRQLMMHLYELLPMTEPDPHNMTHMGHISAVRYLKEGLVPSSQLPTPPTPTPQDGREWECQCTDPCICGRVERLRRQGWFYVGEGRYLPPWRLWRGPLNRPSHQPPPA